MNPVIASEGVSPLLSGVRTEEDILSIWREMPCLPVELLALLVYYARGVDEDG